MRTCVKICGITRQQDAEFAAKLGVDAIGLVFYPPSPRAVDVAQAKQILAQLPPFVTRVGLFVNAEATQVDKLLNEISLDVLQFHGEETPDYCSQFGKPYMKAIRMRKGTDLHTLAETYHNANALLLDSYQPGMPGGTGESFDWSMITSIQLPIVLAGGLNAGNVAMAIQQVHPYAVDVSGGVEQAKGIKNSDKMRAFMKEVRNV